MLVSACLMLWNSESAGEACQAEWSVWWSWLVVLMVRLVKRCNVTPAPASKIKTICRPHYIQPQNWVMQADSTSDVLIDIVQMRNCCLYLWTTITLIGMCGSSRLNGTAPTSQHWKQQSITQEKKTKQNKNIWSYHSNYHQLNVTFKTV